MKNRSGTITCISLILLLLTAVTVLAVNRSIPFMMDDLWYSTHLYSDEPVRSLSDIIDAQIWHWNNWGGRSITHSLLQMILVCGEGFADVLNTIFVFVLSLVISLTAGSITGRIRNLPLSVLAGCALMLGLNANWKMSMFWESGAANYLYITVFILLFIFCYLRELPSEARFQGRDNEVSSPAEKLPGITRQNHRKVHMDNSACSYRGLEQRKYGACLFYHLRDHHGHCQEGGKEGELLDDRRKPPVPCRLRYVHRRTGQFREKCHHTRARGTLDIIPQMLFRDDRGLQIPDPYSSDTCVGPCDKHHVLRYKAYIKREGTPSGRTSFMGSHVPFTPLSGPCFLRNHVSYDHRDHIPLHFCDQTQRRLTYPLKPVHAGHMGCRDVQPD